MMVALFSATPHSSSSYLQSKLYTVPFTSLSNCVNENSTCCIAINQHKSSARKQSISRYTIRSAATKSAKTPAEEEWKTKRELLLQTRILVVEVVRWALGAGLVAALTTLVWVKMSQVRSVDVKEALRLQQQNNFVILNVRPEAEFKEAHSPGAINVQIYRLIKEWTAWDIFCRRVAFAFFGIFAGTEENPEFLQNKNSKIRVACASGGTMKPTQNLPEGQQSRSLIAAYLLVMNGYDNVFHLEEGLYQWFKEDLPIESEE